MNKLLLIKRHNCIACDILDRTIEEIIDKYNINIKLESKFIDDINEEDKIYREFSEFPVCVFIKDDVIKNVLIGTQSKHKIFSVLESL